MSQCLPTHVNVDAVPMSTIHSESEVSNRLIRTRFLRDWTMLGSTPCSDRLGITIFSIFALARVLPSVPCSKMRKAPSNHFRIHILRRNIQLHLKKIVK